MWTLIIIACLAFVLPLAALICQTAEVTVQSMLNYGANLIQSLRKRVVK